LQFIRFWIYFLYRHMDEFNINTNQGVKTMKNACITFVLCLGLLVMTTSCTRTSEKEETAVDNPLLAEFDTPFGVPPFESIRDEHFRPAFAEAMAQHIQEIEAIVNNPEKATFENTVAALAESGLLLAQVSNVFDNLSGAHITDEMKIIEEELAPIRTKHGLDINLNPGLFQRIKTVFEQKDSLDLSQEKAILLEKTYKNFVRGGANLSEDKKARFREINEDLSLLTVKFGQNVLNDTNAFEMLLESEDDLVGLPQSLVTGYAEAATSKGYASKWLITLHKPSFLPFLMYSEQRGLREKVFTAFADIGNNDNDFDNKAIASKTAALRVERANLLGYDTHAAFILEDYMAKEAGNVYDLLMQVWKPALARAKQEVKDMQAMIDAEGGNFKLQPWDWWYYAEKVNDEVQAFEVKEADGTHVGVLYTDYYPRESKRGGAWMNAYRKQYKQDGEDIRPVIANHGNFSKPIGGQPALISYDEALTMFHEFGHALHGLLSDCTYRPLSGTSVPRDFVELPSQIMEHWASHPDVIKSYARHFETNEPIPDELLTKIKNAGHFNQGFVTVEYLASCFLDMDWHVLSEVEEHETGAFEKASMDKIGLISEIIPRWRSTYFQHIFAGGYSSGYYSYIWAEVLDSDAFEAFEETSLFDQKTASSLRKNILSAGGTDDPMAMYLRFRGAEPKIDPLLKKRGLK